MLNDHELQEDTLKREKKLFFGTCYFLISAASPTQFPPLDQSEIAFAGRSNVGKSSLVNALTGRKTLAKISNTPGRTRELNFFNLDDRAYLVDMPGYGYARAPKQKVAMWSDLIKLYLAGRSQLKRVFLLIDSRHGIRDSDEAIMDLMDKVAVVYHLILTKTDKIKKDEQQEIKEKTLRILTKRPAAYPGILATSSHKKDGLEDVRTVISDLITLP
ncbi:MAG: ribosome biogenesis GTP-binding protein YihA/YsxC [Alphaproteobacteria bacterium]|nr:ribosome biogenesis GTP-binding protein YihA/YsxC [Alphaproteobacteria bacterium]